MSIKDELTNRNLEEIVRIANSRSGACISVEDCIQKLDLQTAKEALDEFKTILKTETLDIEILQDTIALL